MRLRPSGPGWAKTLSFTAIHLVIAVTLGWCFTGSFVLAGLLALIEPAVNTLAHHRLDHWWSAAERTHPHARLHKTLFFGASHLAIAVVVGWALTGSFVLAGALAIVEPLVNTLAHHVFDHWWEQSSSAGDAHAQPA